MPIRLGGYTLPLEPVLLDRSPEIKRTQQILIFLISVILIIYFISFMIVICLLSIKYRTDIYELIVIIFRILFFASGMFITKTYDHNGLLVFAWLGIMNLIFTCIIIVYETVRSVILTTEFSRQMMGIYVTIIPRYICLIGVIFQAVIIILAFKLSYLIIKNKRV